MMDAFQRRRRSRLPFWLILIAAGLAEAVPLPAQQFVRGHAEELSLPDSPSSLAAQTPSEATAMLSGTVTDIAGALVPGATVTLQIEDRPSRNAVTDGDGHFQFPALAAGTYAVLVVAPGLETYLSRPLRLLAGEHLELPAVHLRVAAASASISVGGNGPEVAEEELRLETQQRVLGVVPNYLTSYVWNAAPLNTRQKFKLSYKVVSDPVSLIGFAATAELETNADTFPAWGQQAPSFGKRFGAAFGDGLFSRFFDSAVFPSIFRQDPRYFYMGPSQPGKKRLWHALSTGLIVRGDNGRLEPNYSHLVGNASAGALSTVYHPAGTGAATLALDNTLIRIGGDAAQALLREFVLDHVHHNKPPYANGEPSDAR
jgi:hypothetical protein